MTRRTLIDTESPDGWSSWNLVGVETVDGTQDGHLQIRPGTLICNVRRSMKTHRSFVPEYVSHTSDHVIVYHALVPLVRSLRSVGIVMDGEGWTIIATTWPGSHRSLMAALADAGFVAIERRTLLDIGKSEMKRP